MLTDDGPVFICVELYVPVTGVRVYTEFQILSKTKKNKEISSDSVIYL